MKRAVFVPKEYKSAEFIDGFRGIYMPYWTYHFKMDGHVRMVAREEKRYDDCTYVTMFRVRGELEAYLKGDAYDASLNFYDDISTGLAPFEFEAHKPFSPSFTSSTVPRFTAATMGSPEAMASMTETGSPSRREGKQKISAAL